MKKSTLLHLRIPFSFFLLPVFLLAAGVVKEVSWQHFWLVFVILHFLVYPASNGYNSYFDKDESSIGGLKSPPPVSRELYWVSLSLDIVGLLLGLFISIEFVIMILIYGLVSKAYSHPSVRLKKLPVVGWLAAGVFQGYFTYLMCYIALANVSLVSVWQWPIQMPGILSSLLLLGSYPMTQVYQHEEDAKRGDLTISRLLGIKGTFHFTGLMFSLATAGFCYYFFRYHSSDSAFIFLLFLMPVLVYFSAWYLSVRKSDVAADFGSTMRLNFISSLMLNAFFLFWWIS